MFTISAIWTCCFSTFEIFNTQPLWILNQGWEQGQVSHYIQPSNLSSALQKGRDDEAKNFILAAQTF